MALVASVFTTATAWAANGETSDRIAVLCAEPDGPVARRLRDELGLLGFEVVLETLIPVDLGGPTLRSSATELDVAALIALRTDGGAVLLTVVDRVTGKTVERALDAPPGDENDQARVIALRAIELLRASLRELQSGPQAPEAEVPPTPLTRRLLRPIAPTVAIDVAPAIAGAPGGIGPSVHVVTGVRWFARPRWSVGVSALVPTVSPQVRADEGIARITIATVDAAALVSLRRATSLVLPEIGVAAGVAVLRMDGVARDPFEGTTDHVVTATLRVQAGLAVSIHPNVRLRLDANVGTLLPKPTIVFVDRTVGEWGQPYGSGSLGFEFVFE